MQRQSNGPLRAKDGLAPSREGANPAPTSNVGAFNVGSIGTNIKGQDLTSVQLEPTFFLLHLPLSDTPPQKTQ